MSMLKIVCQMMRQMRILFKLPRLWPPQSLNCQIQRTSPAQDSVRTRAAGGSLYDLPATGGIVTENGTPPPFILSVGAWVALLMGAVFGLLRGHKKL